MPVYEKVKPAKAPAAQPVSVAAELVDGDLVQIMVDAMKVFQSSSRPELLAAAKKAGHTEAEVDVALKYLFQELASLGLNTEPRLTKVKNLSLVNRTKAFDPHAAGQRLVTELQAAEGGAWTGQELNAHFQLTPATLHKRRTEHRIIYWRDARHNFHYPKWQFNAAGALLPGIQEVLEQFKSQDEWRVMSYFLGKRAQLSDQRPLDLLRQGDVARVLEHAENHAQENTW